MTAITVARPADVRTLWPAATAVGDQLAFPIAYIRGGTSRGAYVHARDLPRDEALRDRVILALYGSPDARQIDGIGGAHPLTSKIAIVSPADDCEADVNYLFGQVRVDEAAVDYRGNCGNILAGVGPFAVDSGLVPACEPVTEVRIRNLNTGSLVRTAVPVVAGQARVCGATAIAGVPSTGAAVRLDFSAAAGTLGHGLLPTSVARESVSLAEGVQVSVSIVDAGNPTVFATARSLGLTPETMLAVELQREVLDALESIRAWAAVRLGLVQAAARASRESPAIPKVYIVNPPASCARGDGGWTEGADVSLLARGLVMGRPHPAFASTVAVCTAVASRIPGTVVHECAGPELADGVCHIGHPSGVLTVEVDVQRVHSEVVLRSAVLERTARRIMEGLAFVPVTVL